MKLLARRKTFWVQSKREKKMLHKAFWEKGETSPESSQLQ